MKPDWAELVATAGPLVHRVAWRILGHAQDAEDTVQEVFLELHRLWPLRDARDWRAVLRRMAVCRALDRLRSRRFPQSLEDIAVPDHQASPDEIAVGRELESRLREAIGQLPAREAEVFCLRFFDGLDYGEIAATLGISTSSAGTALHKARAKLESLLQNIHAGE